MGAHTKCQCVFLFPGTPDHSSENNRFQSQLKHHAKANIHLEEQWKLGKDVEKMEHDLCGKALCTKWKEDSAEGIAEIIFLSETEEAYSTHGTALAQIPKGC